ncbi:hypothetical protein SLEP1_g1758 [Rubroshorea leprosula]|uniref:Secreted protein n=1 Tax=Rubroshorea leprosula TaxID=152421 RepID=A0AAV5HLZ6_9ROSI|nr:hypothetical protein SLEP1_g1758 [Rubroshorea leprosula]
MHALTIILLQVSSAPIMGRQKLTLECRRHNPQMETPSTRGTMSPSSLERAPSTLLKGGVSILFFSDVLPHFLYHSQHTNSNTQNRSVPVD